MENIFIGMTDKEYKDHKKRMEKETIFAAWCHRDGKKATVKRAEKAYKNILEGKQP